MANNSPNMISITESPKASLAESSGLRMKKELIRFYSLFALTVFFVYYAPPIFNKAYFIILLALFWKSKRNYFWFAFVFILVGEPGGLFHGSLYTDVHRVPLYNVTGGISFGFYDLFFITAFAKALNKRRRSSLLLKKPLILLLLYLGFLILISLVIGTSKSTIISNARIFTTYTLFISIPFLVYRKEDFFKFIHLVFPAAFLTFIGQIYFLLSSSSLESFFLGSNTALVIPRYDGFGNFIRPTSVFSAISTYFCYISALFLISKNDYAGNKPYLYSIVSICFLSVVVSATRSWIVMYLVVFLLYCFYVSRSLFRLLPLLTGMCLVCFLAYLFVPGVNYAVNNSLRRTYTIIALTKGDVTAEGTLQRIDVRLPRVLEGYKKSPIIGWGITDTFSRYSDYHVGNFNLLLQTGIIGFILFSNFWLKYYEMIFSASRKLSSNNSYKKPLTVLAIGFLGMLILHFTSYQFFGYNAISISVIFLIIIYIIISEFAVREALKEESSITKDQHTT